jgi:PII-like signaling protein
MKTHPKKRLEFVLDASLQRSLIELIDKAGAPGYTVLPVQAGRGRDGTWTAGHTSNAFSMVSVLVICDADAAERLAEEVLPKLEDFSAIVTITDVQVLREKHF